MCIRDRSDPVAASLDQHRSPRTPDPAVARDPQLSGSGCSQPGRGRCAALDHARIAGGVGQTERHRRGAGAAMAADHYDHLLTRGRSPRRRAIAGRRGAVATGAELAAQGGLVGTGELVHRDDADHFPTASAACR